MTKAKKCKGCDAEITDKAKKFCGKDCYVKHLTARAIKGAKKLSTIKK